MMKLFIVTSIITLFLIFPPEVYAQLVSVKPDGRIVWNVLSDQTSALSDIANSSIEVKKVADMATDSKPTITLSKEDGSVNLSVSSGNETRDVSVSGDNKNLVEIEERPNVQKITIGVKNDKFSLTQGSTTAFTDLPINVDAKSGRFSVRMSSGAEYIFILPHDAVSSALRSRLMSNVSGDVEITENKGEANYKIMGEKVFNFFDLFNYSVPITAYVSASTGEMVSIDSPTWFRFVKFLFI